MHVAFFRNVNQGQRGHVATADLIAAFADAGASEAVAFQSNGTVVFAAEDPDAAVADVRELLAVRGSFDDAIYARPIDFLAQIVAGHAGEPDGRRRELTLFVAERILDDDEAVTAAASRRRCDVVAHGAGWAVVRNDRDAQSNGTPTIEAVLGEPATSRGLPTLARLVDRFSR